MTPAGALSKREWATGTVGSAYFSDEEAAKLREYLQKGGFLWADDFWGSYAWENWLYHFNKVLPPSEYRIVDLPLGHPLLRGQFEIKRVPQIPSINFWMGSGGGTSEAMRTAPSRMHEASRIETAA